MKTKDYIKIIILLGIIGIAIVVIGMVLVSTKPNNEKEIEQYYISGDYKTQKESLGISSSPFSYEILSNYTDYITIFSNNDKVLNLLNNVVDENFFNTKSLIIIKDSRKSVNGTEEHISNITIKDNVAKITIKKNTLSRQYITKDCRTYFIPIETKKITNVTVKYRFPINILDIINPILMVSPFILLGIGITQFILKKIKIKKLELNEEEKKKATKKAKNNLIIWIIVSGVLEFILESIHTFTNGVTYKPIIYLYPDKNKKISVKLGNRDNIVISYPKYTTGWNVLAKPNGDLIDLDNKKNLYSLYYECKNIYNFKVEKDGFIIKAEDVSEFLENKLSVLGLNDKEKEEFIIYWLPVLQKNKYNYIRFATSDEINKNMPLEINPTPDTVIRVLMTYKALKKPIDIKEQQLITPKRTGYVAVEWGGTEIK